MSESGQPPERSPKDLVRIVYHTENRTFARLFNEHSLEQLKDVVRRKLGLGQETDILLKQMGPDALLDLEDDDDFQAFRVLLRTSVSMDIQVAVGRSRGAPMPPAPVNRTTWVASRQLRDQSAGTESPSLLLFNQSPWSAAAAKSTPRPEVASIPATTKKTPGHSARKRKVSFGDTAVSTPDKPAEQHAQSKTVASTPVSTETSAGVEEPPKKRQKKEVKAKDVQPGEGVERPSTKASSTPKPKVKRAAVLDRETEDGDVLESPATKPRKDESIVSKESLPPANLDGMDQSISQQSNLVNDTSLQLGLEKPAKSGARRGVSKTRQNDQKIRVCSTIPQTSESVDVQSEVAAAILSDYKAGDIILPPPPPKRKYVKKTTKKSTGSSSTTLAKSTTASHAPASTMPNVPAEPANEPLQEARELNGPPCPICLQEPFHIRYRCPTVLKGPDAIQERLEVVRRTNVGDHESLIKELEGLLRESEATSESLPHYVQSRDASQPPNTSASRASIMPSNSNLSEVTVESRDEGSSSETSDVPENRIERKRELPAPRKQKMPDIQSLPSNDDLEAVIRGPALKRQSILGVLDRIVGSEDDSNSDSDEDGNQNELQEDQDEEIDRSRLRSAKYITHSSDSESEEEESSPSCPATDDPKSRVQGSNNPGESTGRQNADVTMTDCAEPLNGRQDDDSSQETHVGSGDRMAVDNPNRGRDAATVVEERSPSSVPSNQSRESEQSKEPAGDMEPPTVSRSANADPIETPSEDIGTLFAGVSQSTPNPGVTKRIKTRNGQILDDEAEQPVLLEPLTTATPLPTRGKSRRKVTEMSASQEPVSTRRSPRFSSAPPPSASTPAAVVMLNHRNKLGARSGKAAKTPAKQSTDASQSNAKDDNTQHRVRIVPTPSLIRWETLAEPSSSPSLQLDEPSVHMDELMSSPQPTVTPIHGRENAKKARGQPQKTQVESSQERERLFDLSSSQIPFPYSQRKINPEPTAFLNGKEEREVATGSEEEVTTKKAKMPTRYRSLSQLATDATLFSPSLPTPTTKPVANGKTKKRIADRGSSSSSTSSEDDEGEANRSEHIPRGRRAASALETRKRKSLLSGI